MHHATRHGKGCGRYHDTQVSNEPSPNPDESSLDPGDMQVDEVKEPATFSPASAYDDNNNRILF
jgi:hypothetical protein